MAIWPLGGVERTSEDCLTLNVWTSGTSGGKRPVMFWCHARRGNPGWAAYNTTDRPTMIFDLNSRVENDPFGTERRVWEEKR
ncbi:hypothetical protein BH10PSE6_BH10PSE6_18750 [soil metagenome]